MYLNSFIDYVNLGSSRNGHLIDSTAVQLGLKNIRYSNENENDELILGLCISKLFRVRKLNLDDTILIKDLLIAEVLTGKHIINFWPIYFQQPLDVEMAKINTQAMTTEGIDEILNEMDDL